MEHRGQLNRERTGMNSTDRPCADECGRTVGPKGSRGRCSPCAQKLRRKEYQANPWRVCEVDGCDRFTPSAGNRHCSLHYGRVRRHGEPGPAEPQYIRGAGGITSKGYRVLSIDGRRRPEHHWVMERILGRPLEPFENVHHVNGVRDDNRPENLELWVRPQPAGQRAIDLAEWGASTYPDLVAQAARRSA